MHLLKELKKQDSSQEVIRVESPKEEIQKGTLQRWFPGWGGWYGSGSMETTSPTSPDTPPVTVKETEPPPTKSPKLEQQESEIGEDLCVGAYRGTPLFRPPILYQKSGIFERVASHQG